MERRGIGALELAYHAAVDGASLLRLSGVRELKEENGSLRLTVDEVHRVVPALLEELRRQGAGLSRLTTHHATLEDVFVHLTGRHLRDT